MAILLAIMLVRPGLVNACSHLWRSYTVKDDFVIEISNRDSLLQGAEVLVLKKLDSPGEFKTVDSRMSNEVGAVSIRGLSPGEYRILVRHAGITGEQADVKVVSSSAAEPIRIMLTWALRRTLQTEQVLGALYAGKDQTPLFGATLSLAQVFPDRPTVRVKTNMSGQFAFSSVPDGLYILNVAEREDGNASHGVDGNIFIEVMHGSAGPHLPALLLTHTSCGLEYQPTEEKTH